MNERNIAPAIIISDMIRGIKALPLNYEYEYEPDGSITGRTLELQTIENAPNEELLRKKLVSGLKEWAEAIKSDYDNWVKGRELQVAYLVKVLISTEKELELCLHGKSLESI